MYRDFRNHLEFLEKNGKLLRVTKEVNTRFDIAAGTRKISDNDGPALLFENVKDFPGWRVASGIYATQKLIALALGLPINASEQNILNHYFEYDQKSIKPKIVNSGPVKEIIIKRKDVDLNKLPIPIYSKLDVGPYLTAGVELAKHPRTGIQNISIHRRRILSRNRTAILAFPPQHLGIMIDISEKEGKGLPIATAIGAEPSMTLASCIGAPEGVDETEIAGAIQGTPIEMIKCETINVMVPANAEIIIEGMIVPNERVRCGPIGEFTGNYISLFGALAKEVHVIEITAITMRKDPIFQALLTGMPVTENHTLKKWSYTAAEYRVINRLADVKALNLTSGGCCFYHLVVAINKRDDEEPKKIIESLLFARHGPNLVIVVDDDINIFDPFEVEWAIATRVSPAKDIFIFPGVTGVINQEGKIGRSKWGIDATVPPNEKEFYKKIRPPRMENVDYV